MYQVMKKKKISFPENYIGAKQVNIIKFITRYAEKFCCAGGKLTLTIILTGKQITSQFFFKKKKQFSVSQI